MQSTILLGPLQINQTFSIFSITMAITDVNMTILLGWLTVVLDGHLISNVAQSSVGMGASGISRVIGPKTLDNRFPGVPVGSPPYVGKMANVDRQLVFDVIPQSVLPTSRERSKATAGGWSAAPFNVSTYPVLQTALIQNFSDINNAGSSLSTVNEMRLRVGTGFAVPDTKLCDCKRFPCSSFSSVLPKGLSLSKRI